MVKTSITERLRHFFETLISHPVRFIKAVTFYTGAFFMVLFTLIAIGTGVYFFTLPDINAMTYDDLVAKAKAHVHQELKDKKKQYKWSPIAKMNRDLIYTIVMAEDGNYFKHSGINYDALLGSLAENLKRKEFAYGASTITQQVAKNLFLTKEKSLLRKLREYSITKRLEARFTKNQILEVYLNIAELGSDVYGVRAAAWTYYQKRPSQINAAEGALLACLLPSPRRYAYSIFQNHHIAPDIRRKYIRVLKDMRYHEYISPEQYNRYKNYDFF